MPQPGCRMTPSRLVRVAIVLLLLLTAVYHVRGYYWLVHNPEFRGDLYDRWREQHSIVTGATVHLLGQPRSAELTLVHELGFRPKSVPSQGGYPPWSFLPGYIFYWPSWPAVRIWFGLLNLFATIAIAVQIRKDSLRDLGSARSSESWLVVLAVLSMVSFSSTLAIGQIGIVCMAFLAMSLTLAERADRLTNIAIGILLGLAMSKPTLAAPFLFPFVVRRRWMTVGVCVGYTIIASLVVWWTSHVDPFTMLNSMFRAADMSASQGQGILPRIVGGGVDGSMAIRGFAVILFATCGWFVIQSRHRSWLELFACAGVVARLCTYHRSYDNVALIFLFSGLLLSALTQRNQAIITSVFALGFTLWLPPSLATMLPNFDLLQSLVWLISLYLLLRFSLPSVRANRFRSTHQRDNLLDD